jgi:predicted O-methyltransferase YrrM
MQDPDYWHLTFLDSLLNVTKPKVSVEIGVAEGEGTRILSKHSEQVFAVDSDPGSSRFISHLKNVEWINSSSWEALSNLGESHGSKVDFCFIDGDHRSEIAFGDFERAQRLISPEGIIALHDTYPRSNEFASEKNEWCGSAYRVPSMIQKKFPDFECITIPKHPGLTLVQRRISQPSWMP